jgi:hypothetical protein
MKVFRLDDLDAERAANDGAYLRFLKERTMSAGLYALKAGESDPQKPHDQDEIYLVVSGRAAITVGEETTTVARGCERSAGMPGGSTVVSTSTGRPSPRNRPRSVRASWRNC